MTHFLAYVALADTIEANVSSAGVNVEEGREQLLQAARYQVKISPTRQSNHPSGAHTLLPSFWIK